MPSKVKATLNYDTITCYACKKNIKHTVTFVFRKRDSLFEVKFCKMCKDKGLHILLL